MVEPFRRLSEILAAVFAAEPLQGESKKGGTGTDRDVIDGFHSAVALAETTVGSAAGTGGILRLRPGQKQLQTALVLLKTRDLDFVWKVCKLIVKFKTHDKSSLCGLSKK